ncbi:hypothetical protein COX74_00675, partial [bacterium (Candidatus Gribaldobacteria) CG_4_10_14_0_2_um_filter_41_16]
MSTIDEIRKVRLEKLRKIEGAGLNPYPAVSKRTQVIAQALADFAKLKKSKKEIVLAGRIMAQRGHGALLFLNIQDGTANIQVILREDKIGENDFKFFTETMDIGDFVEIKGALIESKTGEKTLEATDYKILAKALLPLPEKWHGLQDAEEKLRKRYLDILFNPEVKEMVRKRAIFWNAMREFLMAKNFLEVETPVLEITTGGADARPFITHHNALDIDVYLRISMGELWQKKLMVAGLEKTFEIGRQFRNEGMSPEHLQDYTQMEFYWAYADYNQGMKLVEEMYKFVAKKTFGTLKFKIGEHKADFAKLKKSKKEIVLAGRIMAQRGHGALLFLNIQDGTANIQVILREDKIGENDFKFFTETMDIGDFVEIKGALIESKTGEKTLEATDYKILAKALLPLPEKWHGLQDAEEKLRKRYLDILFNPEVKEMVRKRAIFWNAMREFLMAKNFLEVETPVLEITTGGADARPFITHHNALDIDVYLRISMGELWQKKLMVAGLEKTFEIGRQFRNEGMSPEHLQDYTQMEFYWAYADYNQGMKLVEEMYKFVAKKTFGTLKFKIGEHKIDFAKKWEKYDYKSIVQKYTGVDIAQASLPDIEKALQKLGVVYDKNGFNKTRAIDNLWKYCRKKISGPGFLINQPVELSPLAKRSEKDQSTTQKFQVLLAGS